MIIRLICRLFILAMPVSVQVPSLSPIHVPRPKIVSFMRFVDLVQTAWILGQPGVP